MPCVFNDDSFVEYSMDIVKYHITRQNSFQAELVLEETAFHEGRDLRSVVADLVGLYRQQVKRLAAFDLEDYEISQVILTRVAHIDNDELVEDLFQCGCLGDFSTDDALTAAVKYDAINLAKRSLARGANIQGIDDKKPPLVIAVGWDSYKVADFLIRNGADINGGCSDSRRYGMPLRAAATQGSLPILNILLPHNPDIEARSPPERETALIAAAGWPGNAVAIRLLLDYGANIEACDGYYRTALMSAAAIPQCTDAMILLLDKGANIEARDQMGQTALICAVINNNRRGIELLVRRGANLEARDSLNRNPFEIAILGKSLSLDVRAMNISR
ncbi:MAG: hypothetical protein Q9183_004747 [Haloplaca sp. 2 TL-2023]